MADLRATLRRLEKLAREVGSPVRYDAVLPKTGGYVVRGGLCKVNGRSMIVCDEALPLVDKVAVVAEVLAANGIEIFELPPILRARLKTKKTKPKQKTKSRALVEKTG